MMGNQDKPLDDWIDAATRILTTEQFRGAMLFKIGEYLHGIGKKDDMSEQVKKVSYYADQWELYEMELLKK